ncbi:helix-turn-helix domain-containing protein [Nocardia blacklockiae]|uniref:helix-turn-helix domain-containing protein n=1 Tax=Nocardia blacklockiae TaxID=480036 RepID=UPI001E390F57|nr:helix-turn-helix transcriptional regulator [Nocardia blacklockiae]
MTDRIDAGSVRTGPRVWPLAVLALPAFVAIWSGWVGLGELTGFGPVHPLPGIVDGFTVNSAITLPIGMETYATYGLYVWLGGRIRADRTRAYAKYSAFGSLTLGALGQVAYHLMTAAGMTTAPWPVTVLVAVLPVAVLGMGAALAHMILSEHHDREPAHTDPEPVHATAVRTDTPDPEPAPQLPPGPDRWTRTAAALCAADPAGRRDPVKVAEVLRLKHEAGLSHAAIGARTGMSKSAVTRLVTAARALPKADAATRPRPKV